MLLALICDPQLKTHAEGSLLASEVSCYPPSLTMLFNLFSDFIVLCFCQLQASLSEYLDAACSLLFELLLVGDEVSARHVFIKRFRIGIGKS